MIDTVSDEAVTHFSQTVVQGYHVFKGTLKEGPQAQVSTDDSQDTDD